MFQITNEDLMTIGSNFATFTIEFHHDSSVKTLMKIQEAKNKFSNIMAFAGIDNDEISRVVISVFDIKDKAKFKKMIDDIIENLTQTNSNVLIDIKDNDTYMDIFFHIRDEKGDNEIYKAIDKLIEVYKKD